MGPAKVHLQLYEPTSGDRPRARAADFEALFRAHARYVGAIALRILGRDDEVDDVVQEVFLSAMKGLSGLRSPEACRSWLATVTVRHASRRLRRRRWRALLGLSRDAAYDDVAAPDASPEERALLSRVYLLLDQIPVAERVAWTLRHVEGERLDAVAQLCGCSLATAKRRITAAHEALERMIGDD